MEESRRDFKYEYFSGLTNNFGDNKFGTCGYTIYRSVLALDSYSSHKCSNNYIVSSESGEHSNECLHRGEYIEDGFGQIVL